MSQQTVCKRRTDKLSPCAAAGVCAGAWPTPLARQGLLSVLSTDTGRRDEGAEPACVGASTPQSPERGLGKAIGEGLRGYPQRTERRWGCSL